MDTSKEYIKMCEKAQEIQKLAKKDDGDFCYYDDGRKYIVPSFGCYSMCEHRDKEHINLKAFIWLPHQDQLQEMMLSDDKSAYYLPTHNNKGSFVWMNEIMLKGYRLGQIGELDIALGAYPDGEKLWLAFVMKEKYGKTWNGKEWLTP